MNDLVNTLYNLCVKVMIVIAELTGLNYREINILVFCFIGPMVFGITIVLIIIQYYKIKHLNQQINNGRIKSSN